MKIIVVIWALLRTLFWLPLWLLGLVVFALGLALSPWGTGILMEQGQSRGWYQFDSVEGAPLDHFVLQGLQLEAGPARIRLERFTLTWADDCVLAGRLCIDDLAVEGASIRLAASDADRQDTAPTEPAQPASLSLPFPIEIRALSLNDVDIRLADGTRLDWKHFSTAARAEHDTLHLAPTVWQGGRLTLPVSPGATLALSATAHDEEGAAPPPRRLSAESIDAAIAAQSPLPAVAAAELEERETPPLDQRERLTLPEVRLPLAIEVPDLRVEDFRVGGAFEYGVERLSLTLEAREHQVRVAPLRVSSVDADAELSARVELRDDYPLEARLSGELWLPERMPELAGERVTLDASGSLADLALQVDTEGPVTLALSGHLDALDPALPFTATLRAEELVWPLPGTTAAANAEETTGDNGPPYRLRQLVMKLDGNLLGYQAALSLQASGPQIPATTLALTGNGDMEHFAWAPVSLALERGSLISHGEIRWVDGLAVNAGLRLANVDPGLFTDAVAGRLNGNAEVRFMQGPEGWQLAIPEMAIRGELQDLPLALDARLTGNSDGHWQIERFDFRQGDNRLSAQGQMGERLALNGDLDAPALAALSPELGGVLRGEFEVTGTFDTPRVELDLLGENLRFADNRLERLRLAASVSGLDDPRLDAQLDIERLNVGGQRFRSIALALEGRQSAHRLTLEAQAGQGMPLSRASLTLEGAMNAERNRYRGRLTPLEMDAEYGEIRLDSPMAFVANIAGGSVTVQPFCLRRRQGGELCASEPVEASAVQGRAVIALRELPMALLEEVIPEGWQLDGETRADVVASWRRGGSQWSLEADLDSGLALSGEDAYGQPWELPESRVSMRVDATQARAEAGLEVMLSEAGQVRLEATIDEPMTRGGLSGRLVADDIRLSPYRSLVAGMERLDGGVSGDVAIGGNLQAPTLDGAIHLTGLQVRGGDIPMEVRDGELNVRLRGDRGTIDGFVAAEEGRLVLEGDAAWPTTDAWEVALRVDGRDDPLLVALPAFGRLRVAPDLQIGIDPSLLRVRGRVEVPWARLTAGQVPPSAVSPSSDEVIISESDERRAQREGERATAQAEAGADEAAAEALASRGMAIDVLIDLVLGPDMQLEAYGLKAGLRGNLEVRQQRGPVQLFGDVNLTDGRFQAFGQDLLIRQGQLLFSGPADQPLLRFEAIRNPNVTEDDVIAGLRVSGSTDAPNLEVFSEPAMDESRALSYLLRGRPPEDGDADGALTSALIGLSLSRTGSAVGQIGQAFGIDDLTLESAGTGDESQVVVSGYLFEDLRVSYGVGIFSPIAELTLRYTLWRNLYLQAVSGAAQAVDLIYSFSLGRAQQHP